MTQFSTQKNKLNNVKATGNWTEVFEIHQETDTHMSLLKHSSVYSRFCWHQELVNAKLAAAGEDPVSVEVQIKAKREVRDELDQFYKKIKQEHAKNLEKAKEEVEGHYKNEITIMRNRFDEQINSLTGIIQEKENHWAQLKDKITQLEAQLDQKSNEVFQKETEVENLINDKDALKNAVEENKRSAQGFRNNISHLQSERADQNNKIDDLQKENVTLKDSWIKYSQEIDISKQRLSEKEGLQDLFEQQKTTFEQEIVNLKEYIDKAECTITELKQQAENPGIIMKFWPYSLYHHPKLSKKLIFDINLYLNQFYNSSIPKYHYPNLPQISYIHPTYSIC